MPKKNDNIVGRPEGPIVGGGRQTPEQAALVRQGAGGKSDAERSRDQRSSAGTGGGMAPPIGGSSQGRSDQRSSAGTGGGTAPAVGGSSQGRSDQQAAGGPDEDRKVAGGLSDSERTHGSGDKHRTS